MTLPGALSKLRPLKVTSRSRLGAAWAIVSYLRTTRTFVGYVE